MLSKVRQRLIDALAAARDGAGWLLSDDYVRVLPGYAVRGPRWRLAFNQLRLFALVIFSGLLYGFFFTILPASFYVFLALPIVILLALVIWALPETGQAWRRTITFLFFGYLVSLAMWPNYLALALPGLPWITSNRLFTFPLALFFLISLSMSERFRSEIKEAVAPCRPAVIALLIFAALQFLTLPFGHAPFSSLQTAIVFQLEWTMVLFVAVWVFREERHIRRFFWMAVVFVVYQGMLGIIENIKQAVFWAPYVPNFLKGDEFVYKVLSGSTRSVVGTHRSQGTFTTSLSYAEFLGLVQPFVLYMIVFSRKPLWIGFGLVAAFISMSGIIFSQSRLGMVSSVVLVVVFVLIYALSQRRSNPRGLIPAALVVGYPIFAACFIALTFAWQRLKMMVWGSGATEASDASREMQYDAGFRSLSEWPFGMGHGNAAREINMIGPNGEYNIDTYYMMIALDYGVIGFFAYFFMILYIAYRAGMSAVRGANTSFWAGLSLPVACAMFNFFVTKSVLSQDDTHSFVFILMGLGIAQVYRNSMQEPQAGAFHGASTARRALA